MSNNHWARLVICGPLLLSTGCATWYEHAGRDPFPTPIAAVTSQEIVGVTMNPASKATAMGSIAPLRVVEQLVTRMRDDSVFSGIVFPYSDHAQVKPTNLLDVTVTIKEHVYWGENLLKAVLVGASIFLLTPALPIHFGCEVDLDVATSKPAGGDSARYRYVSQYDLHYWFFPKKKVFDEWLEKTQMHAVEHVLNQIKRANAAGQS